MLLGDCIFFQIATMKYLERNSSEKGQYELIDQIFLQTMMCFWVLE